MLLLRAASMQRTWGQALGWNPVQKHPGDLHHLRIQLEFSDSTGVEGSLISPFPFKFQERKYRRVSWGDALHGSPGTWGLSHLCWILVQISSGAFKTLQESGAALNPGWRCLRQGWKDSVIPGAGGGSPRPGRRDNKNWPNPPRVWGSSFTPDSQPGRVRKAEAFLTGFLETFRGEILACSLIP